ncbi:MAG TPA: beta-propeller fold lactonase family protein [Candidatus Acidoferrum sp.]|nr:beta-propeller fold lactonase family protein [Candidatus Acidoferrum sp.]
MRRNPRRFALWTVSIFCVLLLAACGGSSPGVKSISIIPATQTISATTTQQFTATVNYTDGATKPGAGLVAWSSGTTSVATIDAASGVATGVAAGTSTITATYKGGSGTAALSVNQLLSIAVTPMFAVIPNGANSTQQFTAMGTFKNPDGTTGNPLDITGMVTWASSVKGVATINSSGLATAAGTGVTSISAALYGVTSPSVTLTVGAPVPIGLQITPALPTAAVGNTVPFTAVELLSDNTTQPLSGSVTWSSATTTAASIGANNGIALGVGTGSSVITATESGTACPGPAACVGTATVTVVPAVSRFAYVGDLNDNSNTAIAEFSVDVANANLNPLNPASVGGKFPQQLVVHPSGKFIYEIDDTNFVQVYDFSPAPLPLGQLKLDTSLGPYQAGNSGAGKAIFDPTGQFLYVVNSQALSSPVDGVYGFTINQSTGALTAIGTKGVPLFSDASNPPLSTPVDILMDHQGKYLYVVNSGNNTINAYSIDPTSGGLTALSSPTIGTGATPNFGTIDPSNTHLYVANTGGNSVTVLKLDPTTGILTSGGADTPVTGATFLFNVAVDRTGKYLYASDSAATAGNNLYAYVLNPDGTLPATAAASYPTGAGPWGMSIDASGTVLAVVNSLDLPTATVSLFSLAPATGVLKPTATVTTATWMNPEYLTFYNAP